MSDYNYDNGDEEGNGYEEQGDYGDQVDEYGQDNYEEQGEEDGEEEYQEEGDQEYGQDDYQEEAGDQQENREYQRDQPEEGDYQQAEPEDEQAEGDNEDYQRDGPVEEDYGKDEVAEGYSNNAEADGPTAGDSSAVKGIFDGFGTGGFEGIISGIKDIAGGSGGKWDSSLLTENSGLSNVFSSGGMEGLVERMISEGAHRLLNIDPSTGAIIGAIAGNVIFNLGGKGNSLTSIGKVILDNIISGKYRRDIHPFVPPVPTPGGRQFGLNFTQERENCLRSQTLFEDPEFPACDRSIYYKTPPDEPVQWLRPGEIVSDPQLIVGKESRFAVKQGALGDCWFLAAVANLTLREELFYRVVPPDQSFTENYAGIFHFQFWRYGQWQDVVIDDKLPTSNGRLIYMHSNQNTEFWSALIEKAYAKLYGSYENLEGGTAAEALEDFTGGLTESFSLQKTDKAAILAMMIRGFQMGSLFGCSIDADPAQKEAPLDNGLVRGHAYSITALHSVNLNGQEVPLVRVRNPWGNSKEWNGAWSDGSSEWSWLSEDQKQKLGVSFNKDGEFWMSFDDFFNSFEELEICNMSAGICNEIMEMTGVKVTEEARPQATWEERQEDGEWSVSRGTAGGCANNADTYLNNPQYESTFTITQQSVEQDGKCTVIVSCLQKYRREMRVIGQDYLPIGFTVYSVGSQQYGPLSGDAQEQKRAIVGRTKVYINLRSVTARFRVVPGNYIIIPSTFDKDCNGEFLIRIYANGELKTVRLQ